MERYNEKKWKGTRRNEWRGGDEEKRMRREAMRRTKRKWVK